jgi:hypothetical protein
VLAERADARGVRFVQGRYLEIQKNQLATPLDLERGFEPLGDGRSGRDLNFGIPTIPVQIKVHLPDVA